MDNTERSTVLKECIAAIEASRRDHRGERKLLREIYWSNIRRMVQTIIRAAASRGTDMSVPPSGETATFLFSVARSGAITGVRESSDELLTLGLSALAIENLGQDYRETLIELTLLDNSAKKLGVSLDELFKKIEPYCAAEFRETCLSFFSGGWRSLDAMGYRESQDQNGEFVYEQAW